MRTLLILFVFIVMVTPAVAQVGPDTIGLWFDTEYTVNIFDPGAAPFQAYLVLHEPTADNVVAMEFALQWPVELMVLDATWAGSPVVYGGYDCLTASYPSPLPATEGTLLATFQLILPSAISDGLVMVEACPAHPCAYYQDSFMQQYCLETTFGGGVVACLGDCSVSNEAASWSSIKSLYR